MIHLAASSPRAHPQRGTARSSQAEGRRAKRWALGAAPLLCLACERGPAVILGHAPDDAAPPPTSNDQSGTDERTTRDVTSTPADSAATSAPPAAGLDAGSAAPYAPVFGEAVALDELLAEEALNPSLTEDQLSLVFNADGVGDAATSGKDIFVAERSAVTERFGPPTLLDTISSAEFDTSPAISSDGLTLWVGRTVAESGDIDIWVSTRSSRRDPWPEPTLVAELNSEAKDIPRPPGQFGLVMPFASQRDNEGQYQAYFAYRSSTEAPFTHITQEPLQALRDAGYDIVDPFLSHDGLSLYFADHSELADLFVAFRTHVDERFGAPVPLDSINTEADERDPWLSADAQTLYFVSDRAGSKNQVFRATRVNP